MLESSDAKTTLRCTQCSHVALWLFQLNHHIRKNHGNVHSADPSPVTVEMEQYPCVYCNYKSNYELSRYEHSWKHAAATNASEKDIHFAEEFEQYSCKHCKYKSHSILSLAKHYDGCAMRVAILANLCTSRMKFKNALDPLDLNTTEDFQCTQCVYKGKSRLSLKRHKKVDHGMTERFNCTKNECSYWTKRKNDLKRHMLTAHVAEDQIEWLTCPECPYRAKQKIYLKRHMLSHAPAEQLAWFTCTECPYQTRWKATLKLHTLTHADWLNCTRCSYRSKDKKILELHSLTHSADVKHDTEWFSCTECSYRSEKSASDNWKKHLLLHTTFKGEFYRCSQCSYSTSQKKNLKRHMVTHAADNEVEWFDCTKCSYRSKRRRNWKRHLLTHVADGDNVNWLNCAHCSHRSKTRRDLERHMLKTHVAEPRACQIKSGNEGLKNERLDDEVEENGMALMAPEVVLIQDRFA